MDEPISQTTVEKCPTCGGDVIDRSEFMECYAENSVELVATLAEVRKAIENYYLALDRREDAAAAEIVAFRRIEDALGMSWEQGAMTALLEKNPKLQPFYD